MLDQMLRAYEGCCMMVLERYPDSISADMARMKLGQHGINAAVVNATQIYGVCSDDTRLMVDDDDIVEAARALRSSEEFAVLAEDADHDRHHEAVEVEVGGPSPLIEFFKEKSSWILSSILFVMAFGWCLKFLLSKIW